MANKKSAAQKKSTPTKKKSAKTGTASQSAGERVQTFKISESARDFYKDTFGSARSGCLYVLEAIGPLIHQTDQEVSDVMGVGDKKRIIYELERLLGPDFHVVGKHLFSATRNRLDLFSKVKNLTTFQRVTLEIQGFSNSGRKNVLTGEEENVLVAVNLSDEALETLEEYFPKQKKYAAMVAVTQLFPLWYESTLKEVDPDLLERGRQAFNGYELPNPVAAGSLIEMVAKARLGKQEFRSIQKMSFFTRLCVEAYCYNPKTDKKVMSTKISSAKLDSFYGGFPNIKKHSFFGTLVADIFPLLFDEAMAKLEKMFTAKEWDIIALSLKPYALDNGPALGQLVVPAVQYYLAQNKTKHPDYDSSRLFKKIGRLTSFEVTCLEMHAQYGDRGRWF